MIISIFIYTTDIRYAEIKTHEIMKILQTDTPYTFSTEPYWKFSDMFVSVVTTEDNTFPDSGNLSLIADKWEKYGNDSLLLTSDTIIGNKIRINDIAMIDFEIYSET